jgi:hypothetical protein
LKTLLSNLFVLLLCTVNFAQENADFIEDFRDSKVVYADFGMSAAPFSILNNFPNSIHKISFKNNFKPILGIGFAYKWFSMRVAFPILGNVRPKADFGETKQFNLGFDYTYKKVYFDLEYKILEGYAIKNATAWDTNQSSLHSNEIKPETGAFNLSLNAWYFDNVNFKMNALLGKRARVKQKVQTWYVKGTFNVFGVENGKNSLIPIQLQNPAKGQTQAKSFSSLDFGLIPGYAYANRYKNWQFSGWLGLGGVIQGKVYNLPNSSTRGFLGLAPRYDLRFIAGYSTDEVFLIFVAEFDNKSIRFNDLIYRQYYYSLRLVGGYRFNQAKTKQGKEKKKSY